MIVEKIISDEAILVQDLEATTRGTKGFGNSDEGVTKQVGAVPDCLVRMPGKLQHDQTPKTATINIQKKAENLLNQNPRKICQKRQEHKQSLSKQAHALDCLVSNPGKLQYRRTRMEATINVQGWLEDFYASSLRRLLKGRQSPKW